jgi:hypothetical protein
MERLSIVVAGMVAGDPGQGGATWAVLQYVLGLRALGHRVLLVEPVDRLDPASTRYFEDVVRRFELRDSAALALQGTRETVGVPYERLRAVAAGADLLINISGVLRDDAIMAPIGVRAYVDVDPAFNQLWHAAEGIDLGFDRHERFVTVGLAVGEAGCPIPTCGRTWLKTVPPVFMPLWGAAPSPSEDAAFTTVGHWRSYGSIDYNGVRYGQKAHSMRELLDLPSRTRERLALALAVHPGELADREALSRHGWQLVDPGRVAGTPDAYRAFIRGSKGELGIAKSGYAISHCGWFSDRSACYLASGRPVVAQDTGFSRHIPCGPGLRTFSTTQEAADALASVSADYAREARGARRLAQQELDSAVVLRRLLEALR